MIVSLFSVLAPPVRVLVFYKELSWVKLMKMFPDDATAEAWFANKRWENEPTCPHCQCKNVQVEMSHPTMPYRCRNRKCKKFFSVRIGTTMQDTKLSYQTWAIAIYILETGKISIDQNQFPRMQLWSIDDYFKGRNPTIADHD